VANENPPTTSGIYLSIPDNNFETILIEQGIDSDKTMNQQISKLNINCQ